VRRAEILGVSVDSVESHLKWAKELGGVNYPLLSDEDKTVSRLYDVLDENEGVSLRTTSVVSQRLIVEG
jgi:alkyl hydroperoxide reductase subunit AhpC